MFWDWLMSRTSSVAIERSSGSLRVAADEYRSKLHAGVRFASKICLTTLLASDERLSDRAMTFAVHRVSCHPYRGWFDVRAQAR